MAAQNVKTCVLNTEQMECQAPVSHECRQAEGVVGERGEGGGIEKDRQTQRAWGWGWLEKDRQTDRDRERDRDRQTEIVQCV